MLCPVCRHDNFEGEDTCTNCGADLSAADLPQPAVEFHDTILGSHLDALGIGEPSVVEAGITVEAPRPMPERNRCQPDLDGDRLVDLHGPRRGGGSRQGRDRRGLREFMTPDPGARPDTASRSPQDGRRRLATSRWSTPAAPDRDSRRPTSSVHRQRPRRGGAVRPRRYRGLADNLIWATRLPTACAAQAGIPYPVAGDAGRGPARGGRVHRRPGARA
jgi:hypothetical protein